MIVDLAAQAPLCRFCCAAIASCRPRQPRRRTLDTQTYRGRSPLRADRRACRSGSESPAEGGLDALAARRFRRGAEDPRQPARRQPRPAYPCLGDRHQRRPRRAFQRRDRGRRAQDALDWPGALDAAQEQRARALPREPDPLTVVTGLRRDRAADARRRHHACPRACRHSETPTRRAPCCRRSGAPRSSTRRDEAADHPGVRQGHSRRRPPLPHGAHALCRARDVRQARCRPGRRQAAGRCLGGGHCRRQERGKLLEAVPQASARPAISSPRPNICAARRSSRTPRRSC